MRIAKNNLDYPLVRDTFSVLGNSRCEVLSALDPKDAFHLLSLSENSKTYCGILPYFGSPSYLYQIMPIRLNISPSIWHHTLMQFETVFKVENIVKPSWMIFYYLLNQKSHMNKLEDLLKALLKNGLKISPKKCQLFRTSLQYMGNEIFIQNRKVCVQPLRNRLEAIQKLQPPTTAKGCRSFAGIGDFLEHVLSRITKIVKTNILLDQKRKTIHLGIRTARFI